MSLPVLVYLYDFIFLSLLHMWLEHFCKYNMPPPPPPRCFSCAEMRLAKCITLNTNWTLHKTRCSFLSFHPGSVWMELQPSYKSLTFIIPFCFRKPKISPPQKIMLTFLLQSILPLWFMLTKMKKQLIFTTLLLLWLEKWLERTLWSNHSKSQVKIDHSVWSTLANSERLCYLPWWPA